MPADFALSDHLLSSATSRLRRNAHATNRLCNAAVSSLMFAKMIIFGATLAILRMHSALQSGWHCEDKLGGARMADPHRSSLRMAACQYHFHHFCCSRLMIGTGLIICLQAMKIFAICMSHRMICQAWGSLSQLWENARRCGNRNGSSAAKNRHILRKLD